MSKILNCLGFINFHSEKLQRHFFKNKITCNKNASINKDLRVKGRFALNALLSFPVMVQSEWYSCLGCMS